MHKKSTLIILGPTASGKTGISEYLAEHLHGEVINCDMAQMYQPLAVGTAKPYYKQYPFRAHLFDEFPEPLHADAAWFCKKLESCLPQIAKRESLPLIVGGTFFYIKALFFRLHESPSVAHHSYVLPEGREENLWQTLFSIDPERAQELHAHDHYRIKRALDLFYATGKKPSALKPRFEPLLSNPFFIIIKPDRDILRQRITQRTEIMLKEQGWIEEAKTVLGTPWQKFIVAKGFIGYEEIFALLASGKEINSQTLKELEEKIIIKTWAYAKRQETFLRSFLNQLIAHDSDYKKKMIELSEPPYDKKNFLESIRFRIEKT